MKKILIGAVVCAAVAGVVWYLYDEENFRDTLDDLKEKADDTYGKLKDKLGKRSEEAVDAM